MYILVLDIGTTSMRGIVYDEKGNECCCSGYETPVRILQNGYIEQNPDIWLTGMKQICMETIQNRKVDAIAVTAFRSAIIPADNEGNALYPCIMWQDKRNCEICSELSIHNDYLKRTTGSEINTVFSGSRMTWIKRNLSEIYRHASKLITVPEYIMFHLTGNNCSDYTYGSRSHLMNLETLEWDDYNCKLFEIEKEKLSELTEPGTCVGTVTEKAAKLYGITGGTRIITSGGDQQCSAVGLGVFNPDKIVVNHGTGSFVLTQCDRAVESKAICNISSLKGKYILEYNILSGAAGFDWMCRLFEGEAVDYGEINRMIESVAPGADGVYCLPYFAGCGTRRWSTQAKALFGGIGFQATKGHMLRAVLEGIAVETRKNLADLAECGIESDEIRAAGGLTNSQVFNQIQADVYGKNVVVENSSQATAFGAFLIAVLSLGLYDSIENAYHALTRDSSCHIGQVYNPNRENYTLYQCLEEKTERMLDAILMA